MAVKIFETEIYFKWEVSVEANATIARPSVLAPPNNAGIGGDITYTPRTSAVNIAVNPGPDPTQDPYGGYRLNNNTIKDGKTFSNFATETYLYLVDDTIDINGGSYWEVDLSKISEYLTYGDEIKFGGTTASYSVWNNVDNQWDHRSDFDWVFTYEANSPTVWRYGKNFTTTQGYKGVYVNGKKLGSFVPEKRATLTLADSKT